MEKTGGGMISMLSRPIALLGFQVFRSGYDIGRILERISLRKGENEVE